MTPAAQAGSATWGDPSGSPAESSGGLRRQLPGARRKALQAAQSGFERCYAFVVMPLALADMERRTAQCEHAR
eukprot:2535869-Alexandrium_andersonii.AAC.1